MTAIKPKKGARKAISTRRRFEIFKRDGFTCQYCGAHPPAVILHCDHVVAVANGGSNDDSNLVTSCENCNLGKSAVPLDVVPQSLASKAAEVAEREAQLRGYSQILRDQKQRREDDAWDAADVFVQQFRLTGIRKDWFQSILRFVDLIGAVPTLESMEKATATKPWAQDACFRYFCGICWNKAKEAQP